MVHRNLRRQFLHAATSMVQFVYVDGACLPSASLVLGRGCLDPRYVSPQAVGVRHVLTAADDPKVPIHLLIYAVQTALTTVTCIADYLSWSGYPYDQKIELGKLYVPYLAICKSRLS